MFKRFLTYCVAAFFIAGLAFAKDPISLSEFRRLLVNELQEAYPDTRFIQVDEFQVRYESDALTESGEPEFNGYIYLESQYQIHLTSPETLSEQIQNFVTIFGRSLENEDLSDVETRFVALLRPDDYLSGLPGDLDAPMFVTRPFAADLVAVLMLDSPTAVAAVTQDQLAEFDLTEDEAFALAAQNFDRLAGEVVTEVVQGMTALWTENSLGAGWPLRPGACTAESTDFGFWLMDRGTIVTVGLGQNEPPEGFHTLMGVIQSSIYQGTAMSGYLIMCVQGEWTWIQPEPDGRNPQGRK